MLAEAPVDRFVGRRDELDAVERALREGQRLITLVAPGGMGKTRLALELLARVEAEAYEGGARFCALGDATDVESLCRVVAHALGVDAPAVAAADPVALLGRALRARGRALLFLDDVEQIVDAAARAASEWLRAAPRLQLVVTSRERLRVRGERVIELDALPVPRSIAEVPASPSVELLADRVRALRPDWALGPSNVEAVWHLSVALEGIPLAIELAAARLVLLEPAELLARLPQRLTVLSHAGRDAGSRRATLRDAIDGSWRLLKPEDQAVLAQCAIFRGGFSIDAAEAILVAPGAPVLDALQGLREKSLLRAIREEGRARFDVFESIRVFALEEITPGDGLWARFRAYYLALARGGAPRADLAREAGNFAAIVDHALAVSAPTREDAAAALEALLALDPTTTVRGLRRPYVVLLDEALSIAGATGVDPALLARGLDARARARQRAGELEAAQNDFAAALAAARSADAPVLEAAALLGLGVMHHELRELERAQGLYEQALSISRAARDAVGEGRALGNLAAALHDTGQFEAARAQYADALALVARAGERRLEGIFLSNLGILDQEEGDFASARARFERAQALLRASGDRRLEAICIGDRASLHQELGELDQARALHEASLRALREIGDVRAEGLCLARLGAVAAVQSRVDDAASLFAEAEEIFATLGDRTSHALVALSRAFLDVARGDLAAARARVAAASTRTARGEAPLVERSDDARRSVRTLERALRVAPGAEAKRVLMVGRDAASFRPPDGEWHDLGTRRAARMLLAALVEQHRRGGAPLSNHALWAAAWPGEKTVGDAWLNRLHVALSYLRRSGLRAHIVRVDDGYRLDPSLAIEHVDDAS